MILDTKYYQAREKDIVMEFCHAENFSIPIEIEEFVILISNVLENAINASAKLLDKRIIVKLSGKGNHIIFSVKNTCLRYVDILDNKVVFDNDDMTHGYGLQNVYAILKKHGYQYLMNYEKGWFMFIALL